MTGKIEASINAKADDIRAAGAEGHHLVLGPGPALEAEWTGAGLELPNVEAMTLPIADGDQSADQLPAASVATCAVNSRSKGINSTS